MSDSIKNKVEDGNEANEQAKLEAVRIESIKSLTKKHNMADVYEKAVFGDWTVEATKDAIMEALAEKAESAEAASKVVRSEVAAPAVHNTKAGYSLARAVDIVSGDAAFDGAEREVHEEFAKTRNVSAKRGKGLYIPLSLVMGRAANLKTNVGQIVEEEYLANEFEEIVRKQTVAGQLGIQVMGGLVGDIEMSRQLTGASYEWVGENVGGADQNVTTANFTMSPKTATSYATISRRMLQQSNPAIERLLRNDMGDAALQAIEEAVFGVGGSNKPTGIFGVTAGATPDKIVESAVYTNGGAVTRAIVKDLIVSQRTRNQAPGAFATTASIDDAISDLMVDGSETTFTKYLKEFGDEMLMGRPFYTSDSIPTNLEKGSSGEVCHGLVYGDFSKLIMAQWAGAEIVSNDGGDTFKAGGREVRLFLDIDVNAKNWQAFKRVPELTVS